MIIKTVTNEYEFADWIRQSDSYSNNFTVQGARALQAYLDELSDELEENIQFDPIAWCCEWSEYENLEDYNEQHFSDNTEGYYKTIGELNDNTVVIEADNTIIVQDF